ncbi:MAG TPA: hypothetical protein VIM70_15170 [Clostridium sp.]|uniref:hypothetical protein n=1 Tax=Clostridium sp. TaxID=1506 RepID=UPI002F95192F
MKIKGIILSLIIGSTLLVGCGTKVSDDKAKADAISKIKTESITKAKAEAISKANEIAKAKEDANAKAEAISKANAVTKPAKADTATSASKKN